MTTQQEGKTDFADLTPEEKYQQRMAAWQSIEGMEFDSDEIARSYQQRVQRLQDVIELKQPDQVPSIMMVGGYYANFAGITQGDTYYDAKKTAQAVIKFMEEFQPEYGAGAFPAAGRAYDLLGYNIYKWPGGALPETTSFQYVEGEYMSAEDYDRLINDPTGYMLRVYLPRVFDNLQGLALAPNLFKSIEMTEVAGMLMPLTIPQVRESFETLFRAADSLKEELKVTRATAMEITRRWGAPPWMGAIAFAPFDIIGDSMRGTRGIMMDLYRRPDKVLAACEAVTPASIQMATSMRSRGGPPVVFMPLHKGADGFMSQEQFETFYWPFLKKQLDGIIAEGIVPLLFVEGGYNERLDFLADADLPNGRTAWLFDRTDMQAAKEKLGGRVCIAGNVPSSLFSTGAPEKMDEYCRKLIETAGKGGGFILTSGCPIDQAVPENTHAFFDSTRKYGVY